MVTILFQTESHFPVNRKKIKEAIVVSLSPRVKRDTEVSVSIIGDRRMGQLNKQYRNKDHTTDVLSFPQSDPTFHPRYQFIDPPDNILHLGDIVVSYPQAIQQASEENKLVDTKIIELVLHGLDHLLGIHHAE